MISSDKYKQLFMIALVSASLAGCASRLPKADIAATANPTDEVQKLDADISSGRAGQYDVLAADDFKTAEKYLDEAKEGVRDQDSQESILDDIGYGRAYLQAAQQKSTEKRVAWEGVLKTRKLAIDAGASSDDRHKSELEDIDEDFSDLVDKAEVVSPKDFSNLQERYMTLELASLKTKNLGRAKSIVDGAKESHKAKKDAPKALQVAEIDLKNAENMIVANRAQPEKYRNSVLRANSSADFLMAVLTEAHRPSKTLDEVTATNIVLQNQKLASLENRLDTKTEESANRASALDLQGRRLEEAGVAIRVQQAMETARMKFTAAEADVYQQGDKLLIRLKSMNFAAGKSEVPTAAFPLLTKVISVTDDLQPKEVVVEGHTDSTGSMTVNDRLSQERAQAVLAYLQSNGMESGKVEAIGYGFKKPIASNKTKEGRAQNRRVDIIISPSDENAPLRAPASISERK